MTGADFKALCTANGGYDCVMGLMLDNSVLIKFSSSDPLKEEDIVTIGGSDFLVNKGKLRSKYTRCYDLSVTNYYLIDCIQAIQFVDTPADRDNLDITEYTDLHA